MATSPVDSSNFHLVIRELGKVRTKGGLAALNLGLLFLGFIFILFLGKNMDIAQIAVTVLVFLIWQGFAVFCMYRLPDDVKELNSEIDNDLQSKITKIKPRG